nr:type II toxin-antitoxin system RelE/ParE family toxin [uncultured Sellimonas sp.]
MIFNVVISEQAEEDLRGIYEYIAFELLAPENAAKQLDRLEKQILSLDELPERFQRYGKEPWHSRGLRFVAVDNYIVFYITDIEEQRVTILRVMYSGRNMEKQLSVHTKQ